MAPPSERSDAIGTRYNYFVWDVNCPIFPLVRATGLEVKNWQDLILVNQLGQRFYDETKGDYPHGNMATTTSTPYTPQIIAINARITYDPTHYNYFNAAVAMNAASEPPDYAAGPIWAIFDADTVAREGWQVTPPYVDPDGYCFQANTLAELAAAITNPYQARPDGRRHPAGDGGALQYALSTPGPMRISASPRRSIRSRRRRSMPPGPRRWCTTRVPVCGSTPSARCWTCRVR